MLPPLLAPGAADPPQQEPDGAAPHPPHVCRPHCEFELYNVLYTVVIYIVMMSYPEMILLQMNPQ